MLPPLNTYKIHGCMMGICNVLISVYFLVVYLVDWHNDSKHQFVHQEQPLFNWPSTSKFPRLSCFNVRKWDGWIETHHRVTYAEHEWLPSVWGSLHPLLQSLGCPTSPGFLQWKRTFLTSSFSKSDPFRTSFKSASVKPIGNLVCCNTSCYRVVIYLCPWSRRPNNSRS